MGAVREPRVRGSALVVTCKTRPAVVFQLCNLVVMLRRRLDAEKLEGRHFGEASCREYRESVLHVLPHVWDSPADTRLAEAHFVKHRVGRGAAKRDLAASAANKGALRMRCGTEIWTGGWRLRLAASAECSLLYRLCRCAPRHEPGQASAYACERPTRVRVVECAERG